MKTNVNFKTNPSKIILVIVYFLLNSHLHAKTTDNNLINRTTNDSTLENPISEESFILLNGIEQWVTIKGDCSKPIILFLHGGPGSPLSPYSDALQRVGERFYYSSMGSAGNRQNFWS